MSETLENLSYRRAESLAWQFLLAARKVLQQPARGGRFLGFESTADNADQARRNGGSGSLAKDSSRALFVASTESDIAHVVRVEAADKNTCLWLDERGQWCRRSQLPTAFDTAFDLYLPVLGNLVDSKRHCVTAHLGQSIDAQIATSNGDSFYVTGEENRKHLHCMRALSDAVIVGAGTVIADNPQLTTRAVTGDNPVRVVIDPQARLKAPLGIFSDGQARTIMLHQSSADLSGLEMSFGPVVPDGAGRQVKQVERWVVPDTNEAMCVNKMINLLSANGHQRLFVEGGGVTVSRFFEAQALDRLQVTIAPLLVGKGTRALQIEGVDKMMHAHRPPHSIYRMGDDILWDFDLSDVKGEGRQSTSESSENTVNKDTSRSVVRLV